MTVGSWQVQEAKQRFSELVRAAAREPQIVSRHGRAVAVVLDIEEYRRLRGDDFSTFLLNGPVLDDELVDELAGDRMRDLPREVELG